MRIHARSLALLGSMLLVSACGTTRQPLNDVPAGTYVLVEPASDVYNAVSINDRSFSVRMGNMVHSGQHWRDANGLLHMADDAGPCAGQESIWNYGVSGRRVTLNLVEDRCTVRPTAMPTRMVYERR